MSLARLMMMAATGGDVFAATTYTGTGAALSIENGLSLSSHGGAVWLKKRSAAAQHVLVDTVRGAGQILVPNDSDAEATDANTVTGFNVDGFDLGDDIVTNESAATYVAWSFLRQVGFFDIVTYTGDATAGKTVAHNLGVAPGAIITKSLDTAQAGQMYHRALDVDGDGAPETDAISFFGASIASDQTYWNDTAPTASAFTLGADNAVNKSGDTFVAYLFAHNPAGKIQCGGYTGNGSATGPTVTLGRRPVWLMIYRWDTLGDQVIYDSARDPTNPNTAYLLGNTFDAEASGLDVDFNADGFQIKTSNNDVNSNLGEYLYIAITE